MKEKKLVSMKEIIPHLKNWFLDYSAPLFHISNEGRKELVGSGTFINLDNLKVLVTARHVITDYPYDQIFVPNKSVPGLIHLFGICKASLYPLSIKDDPIDIAYYWLDDKCISEIERDYKFLPKDFLNFNHVPSEKNIYNAVGVPYRKAKFMKAEIGDVNLVLENIANPGSRPWAYKDGFNPNDHIIMDYNRKMLNEGTYDLVKTPRIEGMSGGSLWFIDPEKIFYYDRPNVTLVGILTDYCTQHIYATNIKHLNGM